MERTVRDEVKLAIMKIESLGISAFTSDVLRSHLDLGVIVSESYLPVCLKHFGYVYDKVYKIWKKPDRKTFDPTSSPSQEIYHLIGQVRGLKSKVNDLIKENIQHIKNTEDLSIENTHLKLKLDALEKKHESNQDQIRALVQWLVEYSEVKKQSSPTILYVTSRLLSLLEENATETTSSKRLVQVEKALGNIIDQLLNSNYCINCKASWFCRYHNQTQGNASNWKGIPYLCSAFEKLVKDVVSLQDLFIKMNLENIELENKRIENEQ